MENRAAEIKKMISHKHIIVKVRPLQHSGTISTQANVIRLHRPLDVPRSCQVEILYLLHAAISRNIKVTIWPRVQTALGPKVVAEVPAVMLFSAAHSTASA